MTTTRLCRYPENGVMCDQLASFYVMGPHPGDWADYYCREHKELAAIMLGPGSIIEEVWPMNEQELRRHIKLLDNGTHEGRCPNEGCNVVVRGMTTTVVTRDLRDHLTRCAGGS